MLTDITFEKRYRTGEHEPIDFYVQCLKKSYYFDRAAGYFSSQGLAEVAKGLAYFIHNEAKMRLVVSPYLSVTDKELLEQHSNNIDKELSNILINSIEKTENEIIKNRLSILAWMLEEGKIEIKIALPIKNGKIKSGLYHEKIGVFKDQDGNFISFSGSNNETSSALITNFESFYVFRSWDQSKRDLADQVCLDFENLWTNQTTGLQIFDLDEAVKIDLLRKKTATKPTTDKEYEKRIQKHIDFPDFLRTNKNLKIEPKLPAYIQKLWEFQTNARDNWIKNDHCGFFKMATGTGKTVTALICALYLYEKHKKIVMVIVVPTITLCDQWREEVEGFSFQNVLIINSNNKKWYEQILRRINHSNFKKLSFCLITTYASFNKPKFQSIVKKLPADTLMVADEAHNFGSEQSVKFLPKEFSLRIGLSATPDRYFDNEGTSKILKYFRADKKLTQDISIKDAIEMESLCQYNYYPTIVELTSEEMEEYKKISKRIYMHYSSSKNPLKFYNDDVSSLLIKRKRIIHKAYNKIAAFRKILIDLINKHKDLKYTLVYVPEGKYDHGDSEEMKLINQYSHIIHSEFNLKQRQFIGGTKDRKEVLESFANGEINVLTAMKCLDEGVDIKIAEFGIFLSSTGNPRQFIQRRGRLLRTHEKKHYAKIYDLVVIPDIFSMKDELKEMEKNIIKGELARVYDFANTARNKYQGLAQLDNKLKDLNIDIFSRSTLEI